MLRREEPRSSLPPPSPSRDGDPVCFILKREIIVGRFRFGDGTQSCSDLFSSGLPIRSCVDHHVCRCLSLSSASYSLCRHATITVCEFRPLARRIDHPHASESELDAIWRLGLDRRVRHTFRSDQIAISRSRSLMHSSTRRDLNVLQSLPGEGAEPRRHAVQ